MNFDTAVEIIFGQEGIGTSNDPDDPGGLTTAGITQQTFDEAKQRGIIPQGSEFGKLSLDQAKQIYKAMYWDSIHASELPPGYDLAAFDAAVNMGVSRAISMLQQAVGVRIDGVIGKDTLAAAKNAGSDGLDRMLASRAVYYGDLVATKPSLTKYKFGWLRRCFTIARLATRA